MDGTADPEPSFFQEYKYKLEKVYSHFYTQKGAEIARSRQQTAVDYYNSLYREVCFSYEKGVRELTQRLESRENTAIMKRL